MANERFNLKGLRRLLSCALLAVGCLGVMLFLSSCGKQEISIVVKDGYAKTTVSAYTGDTVEEILDAIGTTLAENDVVSPELDYKLTEEDTDILIERYAAVTVVDAGETYDLELTGATVQDALDEAGITLGENDTVDQDADDYLTDGMTITVTRSYAITLLVDGETSKVTTGVATVEDLVAEQQVSLGDEYEIDPALDTPLEDGMEITIKRTITEEVVEEEEIEYETTYEDSSSLKKGDTSVKQEGVNGKKEVTYEVTYVNGEEVSREAVSENVIVEPVDEIILNGTKTETKSSSSSSHSTDDGGVDIDDCDGSGHGVHGIINEDGIITPIYYY